MHICHQVLFLFLHFLLNLSIYLLFPTNSVCNFINRSISEYGGLAIILIVRKFYYHFRWYFLMYVDFVFLIFIMQFGISKRTFHLLTTLVSFKKSNLSFTTQYISMTNSNFIRLLCLELFQRCLEHFWFYYGDRKYHRRPRVRVWGKFVIVFFKTRFAINPLFYL